MVKYSMSSEVKKICLTPLSPVHVGCGLDYDPSGFVYERQDDSSKGILYCFDASRAYFPRNKFHLLSQIARSGSLQDLHNFFMTNKDLVIPYTKQLLPCMSDLSDNIRSILKGKFRNLELQRNVFYEHPDSIEPYIPGSSLKGVIHTALLDAVNQGKKHSKDARLDEDILGSGMDKSPMRLIKISDLIATDQNAKTVVYCANRCYKKDGVPSGIKQYFESILAGQYRLFKGEITLNQPYPGYQSVGDRHAYKNTKAVIADLNRYFLPVWERELLTLNVASNASRQWASQMNELRNVLSKLIENHQVALVKIGKNSGADSLVLHGEGVAKIRNIKGPVSDQSKTFFAAEDSYNNQKVYLPFGWALLEVDPQNENTPLKQWCHHMQSALGSSRFDMQAYWERLSEQKQKSERLREEEIRQKQKEEQEKQAAIKAEEEKKRELAAMSDNLRQVTVLCEKLAKAGTQLTKPGQVLNKETHNLLKTALNWPKEDQKQFALKLRPLFKAKCLDQGGSGKEMKALLRTFES